jgi:alpha-tubulin suppressor-like RCC1 family protein
MSKFVVRRVTVTDPANTWDTIDNTNTFFQGNNLGIGKYPEEQFDISGDVRITGNLETGHIISNDRWSYNENNDILIDRNIGIGTLNSSKKLAVNGTIRTSNDLTAENARIYIDGDLDVSHNVIIEDLNAVVFYGNMNVRSVNVYDKTIDDEYNIGFNAPVECMRFNNGYSKLYAVGSFTEVTITRRATGYTWSYTAKYFCEIDCVTGIVSQNTTLNATGYTIAVALDNTVYIGGDFTRVGENNIVANRIARWIPSSMSWEDLGGGFNARCRDITIDNSGRVIAVGEFTDVSNVSTMDRIVRWNPTTKRWSSLGFGVTSANTVRTVITDASNNIYIGGGFINVNNVADTARVAFWNERDICWNKLGSGVTNSVNSVAIDKSGNVIFAGEFKSAGGINTNVARWNPTNKTWSAMGILNNFVNKIAVDNSGNIYAGGLFTSVDSTRNRIAKWNQTSGKWEGIDVSITSDVNDITFDSDNNLYVSGKFTSIQNEYITNAQNNTGSRGLRYFVSYNVKTRVWEPIGLRLKQNINDDAGRVYANYLNTGSTETIYVGYPSSYSSPSASVTSLDINGDLITTGGVLSLNYPYNVDTIYDLTVSSNTWSSHSSHSLIYVNNDGQLYDNQTSIVEQPNMRKVYYNRRTFEFQTTDPRLAGATINDTGLSDGNKAMVIAGTSLMGVGFAVAPMMSVMGPVGAGVVLGIIAAGITLTVIGSGFDDLFRSNSPPVYKYYKVFSYMLSVDVSGYIYAYGNNSRSRLGTGTINSVDFQRSFMRDSNNNTLENVKFDKIILSDNYSASTIYALTTDGNLYACGANDCGQLGDGSTVSTHQKLYKYPNLVKFNGQTLDYKVSDAVAVGIGYGNFNENTSSNEAGTLYNRTTLAILDKDGFVWCVGVGNRGQMGVGTTDLVNVNSRKVKINNTLELNSVSKIYGYGTRDYTGFFALRTNGDLYVWGWSSSNHILDGVMIGINGIHSNVNITFAKKINGRFNNEAISRVWTTPDDRQEIFVQTVSGVIYGTGTGHALGLNTTTNRSWKIIDHFNVTTKYLVQLYTDGGSSVSSITDRTCFAITRNISTDRYTLWATGYNLSGNLGIGNRINQRTWVKVPLPSITVKAIKRITNCTTGSEAFTVIMLNNGRLLYSGRSIPIYNQLTATTKFTYINNINSSKPN